MEEENKKKNISGQSVRETHKKNYTSIIENVESFYKHAKRWEGHEKEEKKNKAQSLLNAE